MASRPAVDEGVACTGWWVGCRRVGGCTARRTIVPTCRPLVKLRFHLVNAAPCGGVVLPSAALDACAPAGRLLCPRCPAHLLLCLPCRPALLQYLVDGEWICSPTEQVVANGKGFNNHRCAGCHGGWRLGG